MKTTKTPDKIKKGLECCIAQEYACPRCPYFPGTGAYACSAPADALALIQQLEAQVPRWISVEDRMPDHWRMEDKDKTLINYLVYSPDYGVDIGNWIKNAKMWVCMGIPVKVTHWMPLPEPPEEENK